MQGTDWKTFGIGLAAGVALSVSVYFAWSLLRPAPRETASVAESANTALPLPLDENALVAANAERPQNSQNSPLQLGPGPEPAAEPAPEAAPAEVRVAPVRVPPVVVRPAPRPAEDYQPPEDDPRPDEDLDKPEE